MKSILFISFLLQTIFFSVSVHRPCDGVVRSSLPRWRCPFIAPAMAGLCTSSMQNTESARSAEPRMDLISSSESLNTPPSVRAETPVFECFLPFKSIREKWQPKFHSVLPRCDPSRSDGFVSVRPRCDPPRSGGHHQSVYLGLFIIQSNQ